MNLESKKIWLVGAGEMAKEYLKVLTSVNCTVTVIGRSEENCEAIRKAYNCEVISGGIEKFLSTNPEPAEMAIVSVGIEALSSTCSMLVQNGVQSILLEKPGFGNPSELSELVALSKQHNSAVYLAYNRRFYASVIAAKKLIAEDGGLLSFNFEFTEWAHVIQDLKKEKVEHQNWFYGNSTHIIDTAFFIGGKPQEINCLVGGKNELAWHPSGAIYAGSGLSSTNAFFNYQANWLAPGRWSMEFLTRKNRYIFKPIERLAVQQLGSVQVNEVEGIDYRVDEEYKPGIYLQTMAFIKGDYDDFCTIEDQLKSIEGYYSKMSEIDS